MTGLPQTYIDPGLREKGIHVSIDREACAEVLLLGGRKEADLRNVHIHALNKGVFSSGGNRGKCSHPDEKGPWTLSVHVPVILKDLDLGLSEETANDTLLHEIGHCVNATKQMSDELTEQIRKNKSNIRWSALGSVGLSILSAKAGFEPGFSILTGAGSLAASFFTITSSSQNRLQPVYERSEVLANIFANTHREAFPSLIEVSR